MNNLKHLRDQIEEMRYELNKKIVEEDRITIDQEILELSQKLEKLIVKYLKAVYD